MSTIALISKLLIHAYYADNAIIYTIMYNAFEEMMKNNVHGVINKISNTLSLKLL
jgi:hypothetical protein